MITKGLAPSSGLKVVAIMKTSLMSGAAAALGLLVVAWPLAWAPGGAYAVAVLGAAAALAAAVAAAPRRPLSPASILPTSPRAATASAPMACPRVACTRWFARTATAPAWAA